MVLLLLILVSVLLASTQADTKILNTPDGKTGPEPCIRVCSGVDKNFSGWDNSSKNPGKVYKFINIYGCNFVSPPIVTAVAGSGHILAHKLCPSFTVNNVASSAFNLYSVTDFTAYYMRQHQCRIYWTATGYTC